MTRSQVEKSAIGNRKSEIAGPHRSFTLDIVLGNVDDDVVNVDAKPLTKGLQVARGWPFRFVVRPRGQLKLEQPHRVLFDPFPDVFFEFEFGQQEGGTKGPSANDPQGARIEAGLLRPGPVECTAWRRPA